MSNSSWSSVNGTLSSSTGFPFDSFYSKCQDTVASLVIYIIYTFITVLFTPLYILVLCIGFQRWRHPRSESGPSHADLFTYHAIVVEIFSVFGSVFILLSYFTNSMTFLMLGVYFFCIIFPGQTWLHCLTCVEHYLAVVHPITYRRLRERGGVKIRHVSAGCVWMLCSGWMVVVKYSWPDFPNTPCFYMFAFSITVVLFCCLSVLRVLTRPRPGEEGGHRERVDQSKQRAFNIIRIILAVLLLKLVVLLVAFALYSVESFTDQDLCVLTDFAMLFMAPSSLVLPLLFLHKAGKLSCFRKRNNPG